MSKKMMKRSLALGALMAFVITGNALAAGVSDKEMTVNDTRTSDIKNVSIENSSYVVLCERNILNFTTGASVSGDKEIKNVSITGLPDATAKYNTININGSSIDISDYIYSAIVTVNGKDNIAIADENKITVSEDNTIVKVSGYNTMFVAGASSTQGNAQANNNRLEIKDSAEVETYSLKVASANGVNSKANNNSLKISNSAKLKITEGSAYVGFASGKNFAEASNNSVVVENAANLEGTLYSARAYSLVGSVIANNNTVEIKDATTGSIGAAYVYGYGKNNDGYDVSSETKNNVVKISGNAIVNTEDGIYGVYNVNGVNVSKGENRAVSEGNEVIITDNAQVTAKKGIYGAYVQSQGQGENSVSVNNNSVTISGNAKISSDTVVYGGYAKCFAQEQQGPNVTQTNNGDGTTTMVVEINKLTGTAESLNATAAGNTVNISGNAKVEGQVYGGYATVYQNNDANGNQAGSVSSVAANNIINVSGNADISGATLYGSKTDELKEGGNKITGTLDSSGQQVGEATTTPPPKPQDTSADNTSNNTLNISKDWTGGENGNKEVKTLGNFDEIVIEEMQYGETALTVTDELKYKEDIDGNENSNGTKITVKRVNMSGSEDVSNGVDLNIIATGAGVATEGKVSEGSSATIYKGTSEIIDVKFDNSDLTGANGGIQVDANNITKKTRNDQVLVIGESRAAATAFTNQGSELVETGLDALARDNAKAGDTKAFAAVYGNASEYATGSHVKVNGWSGIVGVGKTNADGLTMGVFFENGTGNYRTYNTVNDDFMRGDGDATYNGGGFLVRKDNANGVYTEASLRAGNLQNELRNAVRGSEGLTGYDVDTFYYGVHVGVGKVIPRGNEGDSIDVYGKFMYTHHSSEDFNIDGSDFHFDSVNSERLRLGFRINEVQSNKLSMYYGAAWEYEFGGDTENTTVGYDLSTPSLGGSTMIGEIGMHYLASEKWSLDLNVRGYSGQRDGFTGSVQANYNF